MCEATTMFKNGDASEAKWWCWAVNEHGGSVRMCETKMIESRVCYIYYIYIWYPYIYESVYTCIYMRNTITWHIYHNMYVLSSNKTERPMKPGLQNKDAQKSFSPNSAGSCMKLDPCPYHPFGWRVVVVGFYQSWVDSHGWAWLQLVNGNIKSIHKSSLFIIFTCFNHIFVTFVYICLVFV
jgi:hypothetical protein